MAGSGWSPLSRICATRSVREYMHAQAEKRREKGKDM
jgi:hypothetical protein